METNLNFSKEYHPKTNGQIERVNQVIEYMLKMYVMDIPSKWGDYLYLVEFAYNNGYHTSLNMSPFKYLYVKNCNTLISWDNAIDKVVIGLEMLKDMEE